MVMELTTVLYWIPFFSLSGESSYFLFKREEIHFYFLNQNLLDIILNNNIIFKKK